MIRFSVIVVLFWLNCSLSTQPLDMAPILADVVDALHHASGATDGVAIIASALSQVEAVNRLLTSIAREAALLWVSSVLGILGALETSDGNMRSRPQGALRSMVCIFEHGEDVQCSPFRELELVELSNLVELTDLVDFCGHGNRAAPAAQDLVGRVFEKSVPQHRFFGAVRMTPEHLDELVVAAMPHLPDSTRGPHAISLTYRSFALLFWLAQGGRLQIIARAVDVSDSTFSKYCTPVVTAIRAGLPKPQWPNNAKQQEIGQEFACWTGGSLPGRSHLYVFFAHSPDLPRVLLMILLDCLANVRDECTR